MHKKVAKLTRIQTEDLQYGLPFVKAFSHFEKWCGSECVFLTWGPDDIEVLRANLALHELDPARLPKSYNLQVIFDNQITGTNQQISLEKAMECVEEPALESHDALNDAKNTAKLCLHLDMKRGFSEYSVLEKSFTRKEAPLDSYHSDCVFPKKEEAFAIRWHMGFSGPEDANTVGRALEQYPLAFALCTADMEASYFMEGAAALASKQAEEAAQ